MAGCDTLRSVTVFLSGKNNTKQKLRENTKNSTTSSSNMFQDYKMSQIGNADKTPLWYDILKDITVHVIKNRSIQM